MTDRRIIKTELKELNSPLPENLSRMPFTVPTGYFEGLPEQVLTEIRRLEAREELNVLSPTLSKWGREIPYSTPADYFNRPITVPAPAPVVSIFRSRWMRYAVAAAVLLAGVFLWVGNADTPTGTAGNKVITEMEKDLDGLNDKQKGVLEDFMAAGLTGQETAQVDNSDLNATNLLAGVSDKELNEFVEQTEWITATNTND